MKKILSGCLAALFLALTLIPASAAVSGSVYTVAKGDILWKIAVRHEIGVSEIIAANPQIKNPDLIYPGDRVTIPGQDAGVLAYEEEVIRLVNEVREKNGLKPLTKNWELCRVARYKSQDMVENHYFSHTSPTYGSPFQMMKDFGLAYRTAGENIAFGQRTPQEVMNAWMNSDGHRANILNPSFTQIGVGYAANGRYWTQMFIG
ncbi:MAG: SafA/ExsA family spore coat assembly protein [Clostridia bacterium]|nr:SafA/ExsA family spore coat assembly protein [Clostridia bacterium]